MQNARHSHQALGFEWLEKRQLLAGDVRITQSGGDLRVAGDSGGNVICIESAGSGIVQVRGFSDSHGATNLETTAKTHRRKENRCFTNRFWR